MKMFYRSVNPSGNFHKGEMTITVVRGWKRPRSFTFVASDILLDVKIKIVRELRCPIEMRQFLFKGELLDDDKKTLRDYLQQRRVHTAITGSAGIKQN